MGKSYYTTRASDVREAYIKGLPISWTCTVDEHDYQCHLKVTFKAGEDDITYTGRGFYANSPLETERKAQGQYDRLITNKHTLRQKLSPTLAQAKRELENKIRTRLAQAPDDGQPLIQKLRINWTRREPIFAYTRRVKSMDEFKPAYDPEFTVFCDLWKREFPPIS